MTPSPPPPPPPPFSPRPPQSPVLCSANRPPATPDFVLHSAHRGRVRCSFHSTASGKLALTRHRARPPAPPERRQSCPRPGSDRAPSPKEKPALVRPT